MASINTLPAWAQRVFSEYQTAQAHAFLLHFNTRDYVTAPAKTPGALRQMRLPDALCAWFGSADAQNSGKQIVMRLDSADGLSFGRPDMGETFAEWAGLKDRKAEQLTRAGFSSELVSLAGSEKSSVPRGLPDCLPAIGQALRHEPDAGVTRACILIVDYAELAMPVDGMTATDRALAVSLLKWANDEAIARTGAAIFIVAKDIGQVSPYLAAADSGISAVLVPLPALEDRRRYADHLLDFHNETRAVPLGYASRDAFAAATAGLGYRQIEDVAMRGKIAGEISPAMVKARKDEIISSEFRQVLEIIEPVHGFDHLGGLDTVKRFFLDAIVKPLSSGQRKQAPMGVLMAGPAGTGKSLAAECLAYEAGVNCVRLDVGRLMGKYVGESEGNLERALLAIDTLAPCIVFIDEIDQTVKRDDEGDSGVSRRIFRRLLEYMSDTSHRGRVVFLAATNRPDLVDPALKRPGRFDKVVIFPVPQPAEIPDMIAALCRKQGIAPILERARPDMLKMFDGWTGAEIEGAIVKMLEMLAANGGEPCAFHLLSAAKRMRPNTQNKEFMTLAALRECNDIDMVPGHLRDLYLDQERIEELWREYKRGAPVGIRMRIPKPVSRE